MPKSAGGDHGAIDCRHNKWHGIPGRHGLVLGVAVHQYVGSNTNAALLCMHPGVILLFHPEFCGVVIRSGSFVGINRIAGHGLVHGYAGGSAESHHQHVGADAGGGMWRVSVGLQEACEGRALAGTRILGCAKHLHKLLHVALSTTICTWPVWSHLAVLEAPLLGKLGKAVGLERRAIVGLVSQWRTEQSKQLLQDGLDGIHRTGRDTVHTYPP